METEGTFRTVDGESVSYEEWHTGEPNNAGNEDCVVLDGYW